MTRPDSHPPGSFHTTRWTMVRLAKTDSQDGRRALADLCNLYYEPVVTFLRYELRDADAAREMSHAFFAQMLAGGTINAANHEQGRFRSYLLGAVKHFLSRQREAARSLKRGGGAVPVSLNEDDSPAHDIPDPQQLAPDAAFDRQWALTLLALALAALRRECEAAGQVEFFDRVKPWLTGEAAHGDQAAIAEACGMTPAALKMAIQRLKRRFRGRVEAEIAATLDDPAMVSTETQVLLSALAS